MHMTQPFYSPFVLSCRYRTGPVELNSTGDAAKEGVLSECPREGPEALLQEVLPHAPESLALSSGADAGQKAVPSWRLSGFSLTVRDVRTLAKELKDSLRPRRSVVA